MGKRLSICNVASSLNPAGIDGGGGKPLLGWSSRKPPPVSSIKVGTQLVPPSLVLPFYSLREGKPLPAPTSSRHRAWQLPTLRCTPTHPFVYPGLSKRRYAIHTSERSGSSANDGKSPPPQHSVLAPPKQAPSVWQIFFTDWLQKQKSSVAAGKKLNVAQEAKEAGHVYNELSDEERTALQQRARALKDKYDREFAAWKRTLTPADIERENAFRTAQRKSGKSRRKNINDPNAPKRPLTAYFLFLQAIRADPQMVKVVFGDATESTRQSVLAAAKWRSMSDPEKQPYLAQASSAKREYEIVRKEYDDRLRSLHEYTVTSIVVYPTESPTTPRESSDDATFHG